MPHAVCKALQATAIATALTAFGAVAPSAQAQETIRFGVSGVHALPEARWSSLDDASRVALVEQRADLAAQMGASVLRLGDVAPALFSYDAIHGGSFRDWRLADAVVGLVQSKGLALCLTVPELRSAGELSEYTAFLRALAERYDGDTDFGVEGTAVNYEFPDIDGSGSLTQADWDASSAQLQTWAGSHRAEVVEIGHQPTVAEVNGSLELGDYAAQLSAASGAIRQASEDLGVMLGGTLVDDQSKQDFLARLSGVAPGTFDAANAHVLKSTDDLTQVFSSQSVAKLGDWVAEAAHPDIPLWLGEMSFGSIVDKGPCQDPRCSPELQAASLIRLTLRTIDLGLDTLVYSRPLEVIGDGTEEGPHTGTGLVQVELQPGFDPTLLPFTARPAYAVWRWLVDTLSGRPLTDVFPVEGQQPNAIAYAVGVDGWVAWYDWFQEVPPGADYAGGQKPLSLVGLGVPSVRVRTLWPSSAGATLDGEGQVTAEWDEELVAVEDGTALVLLGQHPVWITPSDEVVDVPSDDLGGRGDASDSDVAESDAGEDTSSEPPPADDDGCRGGAPSPFGAAWAVAAVAFAWARRRRLESL